MINSHTLQTSFLMDKRSSLQKRFSGFGLTRNISYSDLGNSEIKRLTGILREYPHNLSIPANALYWKDVDRLVHELPSKARSSGLNPFPSQKRNGKVKAGKLCNGHKGLNHHIIYSIWSALQYEFDRAQGKFLYPILMYCNLSYEVEQAVRPLEPVPEMWQEDFDILDNTLPDRCPIQQPIYVNGRTISKWHKQENCCPGCMLARIGSDPDVLCALLTGMVARYTPRSVGTTEDIKSKRIKWVRYWIKQAPNGEKYWVQAWELGVKLREIRQEWEDSRGVNGGRGSGMYGTGKRQKERQPRTTARSSRTVVPPGADLTEPFQPGLASAGREQATRGDRIQEWRRSLEQAQNPFADPAERGRPVSILTESDYASRMGDIPQNRNQRPRTHGSSVFSDDVSLLRNAAAPGSQRGRASEFWDQGLDPALLPPPLNPRRGAANDGHARLRSRRSMYFQGQDEGHYDGYEVSPPGTPVGSSSFYDQDAPVSSLNNLAVPGHDRPVSDASTRLGNLY